MKVDFHCHTTASDGALTPSQLIELAVQHQIEQLAITDHDTTAGYESARNQQACQESLKLISGVEISCQWQGHTIHIVGLDFDCENKTLQAGLEHIRDLRRTRAEAILNKLSARPNFSQHNLPKLLEQQVGEGIVGRGHFAQLLIQLGYVKNSQQAFDRYLKRGRVGFVKSEWPELEQVVNWITQAGGIAIIAHPAIYKFTSNKLNRLIQDFKSAGGQGIEVINQPRSSSDSIGMAERAQRFGLLASKGSDFHRPEHTWRGLGWLAPLPAQCDPVWHHFNHAATSSSHQPS
ncbi:MAG: PHP domain-containing protein [Thiomicrorhabdus chilensis]|uniref:PHP domain-containing protein n=1 Tax=Thiomicrorhabdus chilensis TaxID=63656 RepID=UPI00299E0D99|nr:PHP domain-containing protein [Thiomicrorhabdus chilensis]MDX1348200.1 PHP domain-containing protein [Thiomicrorhabdus chilensis]